MKIKVIDLLNMISKGEEVPKKIVIQNDVLIYNEKHDFCLQDYYYRADEEDATWKIWYYELDDEVEIIEDTPKEEKKIPEKLYIKKEFDFVKHKENIVSIPDKISVVLKINDILDYLEYLKSKGDE